MRGFDHLAVELTRRRLVELHLLIEVTRADSIEKTKKNAMSKDDDRTSVNETIPKTAHSINISRILSHFKANLKSCVNVLASRAKIGNIRQELP